MKGIVAPIDRIAGWLLLIGALLHGYGSYLAYPSLSSTLVWALSGSVAALLLAGINLLRVNRPNDRPLAWICLAGCLLWIGIVCAFAATLPNPIDPRPVYHLIVSLVLVAFSLRTHWGQRRAKYPFCVNA
jgi:peptidoglycan/LPS O-acetylase OafA/YrhL